MTRDEGSAVVDFVFVVVLVLTLFLGVLQFGLALHTRNVLVAAAQEGARFAANADRSEEDGVRRTREVIAEALSPRVAKELEIDAVPVVRNGIRLVEVTVQGQLPVQFLPVSPFQVTVQGHALEERR